MAVALDDQREPVSHRAVRAIQDRIRDRRYPPGSPLPAQRELASDLNVSRASLREALSTLEALGMVRTEAGRGTYVTYREGEQPDASGRWRFARHYDLSQVYDFRYLIEPAVIRLAALEITAGELARLGELHEALRSAVTSLDLVASSELDFAFHSLIVACGRNPLFSETFVQFEQLFNETQRLSYAPHQRRFEPVLEHAKIVEALSRHDPDGCAYYMALHIRRASDRIGLRLRAPP